MKNPYNVALVLTVAICLLIVGYHFLYQDNPPRGGEMVRLGQASDTSGRFALGSSPASDPSRPSPNQPGPNPLGATSTYAPGSPITPPPTGSQMQPAAMPTAPASAAVPTPRPAPTPAPTVTLPGGLTAVGAPTPTARPVEPGTGLTGNGVRPTGAPADGTRPYTIKSGDTFASIAVSVYGSDRYWQEIAQANPRVDPTKLSVGQVIRLPSLAQIRNQEQQTTAQPQQPAPSSVAYTVRPGDTLWSVAVQHYGDGRLWRTIYSANKQALNNNPDQLDAGTKLVIPPAPQGAR
ncbi:MAG: LysM peptidoglycan-binding domain-containing protein [Phycisphaeraceae bacterium]|nr:LysM peptidoglycan-binding domain-containing protein [Phycisphaeraceae bacterium]